MATAFGRILVVDDERELRESMAALLRKLPANVDTAADGREAFEKFRTGVYGVIVSDIKMPNMDGLELMARVRDVDQEIPFVIVTAHADKNFMLEALRLGATDFLDKPFDSAELLKVVGYALDLAAAVRDVRSETESMYRDESILADKRVRLQKMKRAVLLMRRMAEIYR